jgi:hypothetical protein
MSVSAATVSKADYAGTIMIKSADALTLKPKDTVTFRIGVKNTGKAAWNRTGSRFVSVYTYFPKYRTSVFRSGSWYRKDQPALVNEKTVQPGEIGYFEFKLVAPDKVGTYEEGFNVAAEDFTWIAGTQFKIPITVSKTVAAKPAAAPAAPANPAVQPAPPAPPAGNAAGPLAATFMIKSYQDKILAAGGQTVSVTVGWKNIGIQTWQTRILRTRGTAIAATAASMAAASWPNALEPSRIREPVSPGSIGYFTFDLVAPLGRGDYVMPLKLVIDDVDVPGADFEVPVTVTEDAPQLPTQEIPITGGGIEPNIRVGLWNPPGEVVLSNSAPFTIMSSNGTTLASVPAETNIVVGYNRETRTAIASTASGQVTSAAYMRFVPNDPTGLWRVPNFAGWDATLYENRFRGSLELNYYQPSDNVWLIEELPIEQYLRGLAETSNSSAYEYQKALVIAARTYAYFVHSIGGKYDLFDVKPSAADQVYRAYGSETIRPSVVRAVEETRGQMVTYNEEIVVTPYFSRSDGRTRAWEEVWCCKKKPWLISVPEPHDVGKTLWGHGVGMSASGALGWANDGKTYDWILKYYYTGTVLKRIY